MDDFFDKYKSVQPYLVNDDAAAGARAAPVAGGPRALRRHDQVHPVRRVHDVVPVVLGAARVRRAGGHRQRPPLHLRLARRRRRRAARDPRRRGRRVALPDDLQLHRRLPARHQDHPGDPRGQLAPSRGDAPERRRHAVRRPRRRRRPLTRPTRTPMRREPRPGSSSAPTARPAAIPGRPRSGRRCTTWPGPTRVTTGPHPDASISDYLGVQTNNVAEYTGVVRALELARELGARRGPPAARLEAHRRAAVRSLAGQGRQAHPALGGRAAGRSAASGGGPRPTSRGPRTRSPTPWPTRPSTGSTPAARPRSCGARPDAEADAAVTGDLAAGRIGRQRGGRMVAPRRRGDPAST